MLQGAIFGGFDSCYGAYVKVFGINAYKLHHHCFRNDMGQFSTCLSNVNL